MLHRTEFEGRSVKNTTHLVQQVRTVRLSGIKPGIKNYPLNFRMLLLDLSYLGLGAKQRLDGASRRSAKPTLQKLSISEARGCGRFALNLY